jgi:hypothetical protein
MVQFSAGPWKVGLLSLVREVIDDLVEGLALAHPAAHLAVQQGAHPLQCLRSLRVVLSLQGLMDFAQRVFAGSRHAPGEKATSTGVGPGLVPGASLVYCRSSHLADPFLTIEMKPRRALLHKFSSAAARLLI